MYVGRARTRDGTDLRQIRGKRRWKRTGRKEGERETGGKHGGNESAETRGGPASILKNELVRAREGNRNEEAGSDPSEIGNGERALRSQEVIYPEKRTAFGRGKEPDPAESAGGMLPHVQNPCCSHLVPKVRMRPLPSDYQSLRSDSLR
jgi:hypothetical protein